VVKVGIFIAMKKAGLPIAIAAFAVLCICSLQLFYKSQPQRVKNLYGSGEIEGHNEYLEWQYLRLRNPQTGLIPQNIREKELAFAATLPAYTDANRSTNWQTRGPINLGGRTRALAIDVADENNILAGQVSGGMWRSTNGGQSFSKVIPQLQMQSVSCIAQDKRAGHTSTWYYGTGEHYGLVSATSFSSQFSGDGIYKSTDNGVTWNKLPSTASGTPTTLYQKRDFDFVWEMVTNPTNTAQEEVYAAVVNGVWRSIDGGTSWTPVLGLDTAASAGISEYTDLAITSTGVLYATVSTGSASKGIWRSTDGLNWVNIMPANFGSSYDRIEMGISPSDENLIYFIAQTPGVGTTGHSLWKYRYLSGNGTGAGGKWTNLTTNIPDDHCTGFYTFDFAEYSSQSSYDMYITVHPNDTNIVMLGGTNIYRSTTGFTTPDYTWIGGYNCDTATPSNYIYPNHHPDQHKLLFLPSNPSAVISATDGGVMKSDDVLAPTVTWNIIGNGYATGQFYTCAIEPGNTSDGTIIGGLQDNGSYFTNTQDYTQAWKHVFYGDGAYCAIARNKTNYYLSWQTGKTFKFDIDANGNEIGKTRIDPTGASGFQFINPFILDPMNDSIMYLAGGRYIWRNNDLTSIPITGNEYNAISTNWIRMNGSFLGSGIAAPYISTLDMSEVDNNKLYYGTTSGKVYRLDSCRTGNTGAKTDISGANFPVGAYVSCVEVDRLSNSNLMVSFSNYEVPSIFYSSNGGSTWDDVSGNLEQNTDGSGNGPAVYWVHVYNDGTNTVYYAGTSIGLFSTETLQGAATIWTQEGTTTIGNLVVNMIVSRPFDNSIVVATHGGGIFSNKIFTPSAINAIDKNNSSLKAYPNPFTNNLQIEVSDLQQGNVLVEITDISGNVVRRLNTSHSVGNYNYTWDGTDAKHTAMPSGQYIISVSSGKLRAVKRVVKI
jgi:hypothetical protein